MFYRASPWSFLGHQASMHLWQSILPLPFSSQSIQGLYLLYHRLRGVRVLQDRRRYPGHGPVAAKYTVENLNVRKQHCGAARPCLDRIIARFGGERCIYQEFHEHLWRDTCFVLWDQLFNQQAILQNRRRASRVLCQGKPAKREWDSVRFFSLALWLWRHYGNKRFGAK